MITLIYSVEQEKDEVTVTAVVEDVKLVYSATLYDPAEYGPGLCKALFYLDEDETLPSDEEQLIEYLENLNLDWELVSDDDYHCND
jgi:hypothetical protein